MAVPTLGKLHRNTPEVLNTNHAACRSSFELMVPSLLMNPLSMPVDESGQDNLSTRGDRSPTCLKMICSLYYHASKVLYNSVRSNICLNDQQWLKRSCTICQLQYTLLGRGTSSSRPHIVFSAYTSTVSATAIPPLAKRKSL